MRGVYTTPPPGCRCPSPMQNASPCRPPYRQTSCRQTPYLDADPPLDAYPPGYRPPGHVTCDACWEANPSPLWTEWHTGVKTLPCRRLLLWTLITKICTGHFAVNDNYRPQRSCEGYVFTPVCHSVHRGVCLSACWDATPPDQAHPRDQAPPWKQTDQAQPPRTRHPRQTAAVADGTHPTGMHSCVKYCMV